MIAEGETIVNREGSTRAQDPPLIADTAEIHQMSVPK